MPVAFRAPRRRTAVAAGVPRTVGRRRRAPRALSGAGFGCVRRRGRGAGGQAGRDGDLRRAAHVPVGSPFQNQRSRSFGDRMTVVRSVERASVRLGCGVGCLNRSRHRSAQPPLGLCRVGCTTPRTPIGTTPLLLDRAPGRHEPDRVEPKSPTALAPCATACVDALTCGRIPGPSARSCSAWWRLCGHASCRSTAVGVRAAWSPGMAATRLASARAPTATRMMVSVGTVG